MPGARPSPPPARRYSRRAAPTFSTPDGSSTAISPPRLSLGPQPASDPAHAEIFDLEEILDAVVRAFAAEAGLLDAAEGRDLGGDDAVVDADDAVFERLGDAPDAADVAAVEIGGEAELGVVGDVRSPRPRS